MSILKKISPLVLVVLSWIIYIALLIIILFLVFDFGRSQLANKIFLIAPMLTMFICVLIGKIFNNIEKYKKLKWKKMLAVAGIAELLCFYVFAEDNWKETFSNVISGMSNFYMMFFPLLNIAFIFLGYKMFKYIKKTR